MTIVCMRLVLIKGVRVALICMASTLMEPSLQLKHLLGHANVIDALASNAAKRRHRSFVPPS